MKLAVPFIMAALALVTALPAGASFTAKGTDTRQILAEQRQIHDEIESPRGKYSRFNDRAQARLRNAQQRIFELLDGGRTLEQLDKQEQVELLNAVEEVKAVLANNEGDKLECWREAKLGSGMKVTRCETVAMRERLREEARMFKGDASACGRDGSGGSGCGAQIRPSQTGY